MKADPVYPIVHINGTAASSLLDDYWGCYRSLCEARKKLRQTAPHARDYYPKGVKAFHEAEKEHYSRIEKISAVIKELEKICEFLQDAVG